MANEFIISRVRELPVPLVANTMYIVAKAGEELADLVFTGKSTSDVARSLTFTEVDRMAQDAAEAAVQKGTSVFVVANIAERDALVPKIAALVFVKDTSGDPLAQTATGAYVYDVGAAVWLPLPSGGGNDEIMWTNIQGRPSSSPSQIDTAVAASIHINRGVLNLLGDENGLLTYSGVAVSPVSVETTW